ncbi:MAG: hypothetical protein QNJ34_03870 [Xenococcaceae cyanobacterium MO_188.B29]|nr:hypothetical protein [Xenococcaceae cyanobacterium MO_188.B29]
MSNLAPLTESEVRKLAIDWYQKITDKVPADEYRPLLDQKNLKMEFPDGPPAFGFDGFKSWYKGATETFFDQVHTLKEFKLKPLDDREGKQAEVKVIVHWEASLWQPPAPKSRRVVLDAYQTWLVKRSLTSQKPIIMTYIVERFDYAKGSDEL